MSALPEPPPAAAAERPLRVLFFMEHLGRYLRLFESVIAELLDRGHEVHLVFEREEEPGEQEQAWLAATESRSNFRWSVTHAWRRDPWFRVARPVRAALDYAYFAHMGDARAPFLVQRARRRAPGWGRRLLRVPGLGAGPGLRLVTAVLAALDRGIPPSKRVADLVTRERADVVLVTPHLMPGSTDSHYVRSAAQAGIPTCVCVASWDNLSSKQLLRVVPDAVTVWNETQRREAVELHGVPADRVVVTGAQCFDHWFAWPPRPRAGFCARVGLEPSKPYVLYVGGALFPGEPTEAEWVRDWIGRLRRSDDPVLRDAGVLVRPHPKRMREWQAVDLDSLPGVSVWPRAHDAMPVAEDTRADYFDSIYHCAVVVGLNTSAMIEAAIVGKAVHTVLAPEFASSQQGTLHFRYLLEAGGGLLRVADDLDEHLRQLADVIAGRDGSGERAAKRFVASFVRPRGVDTAATPVLADAVEALAARGPLPREPEPAWTLALRPFLMLGRTAFFLRRVRWKLALEARRVTGRAVSGARDDGGSEGEDRGEA